MRSQASIKGHPIHPMLVVYPFAFLTGAFGFSVAGAVGRKHELSRVADHLIPTGVVAGLAAAVAGVVDYLNSVPPHSSGQHRARKHAVLNATALGLFTTSWIMGRRTGRRGLPLALQGLGSAALSVAGWMGGTLVYRNQIGVDHRYADAGKWKEQSVGSGEPALASATADLSDLSMNQMMLVHQGQERIVVARIEEGYAAFQDRCTHKGGPLSDGALICGTVQCPWHGSQFDVKTGEVTCGPAAEPIQTFGVTSDADRRPRELSPP